MVATLAQQTANANSLVLRRNPATGRIVSEEPAHDLSASLRFAARAASAYPTWAATKVEDRAECLLSIASEIEALGAEFCRAMIEEIGAPRSWAEHNVRFAAHILRCVAETSSAIFEPQAIETADGVISRAERSSCGVCLGIAPWNAPLILGVRAFAAPIACGNTILLKGNEIAPRTYSLIGEALSRSSLPKDVVKVFLCPAEESEAIVDALIECPVIRRVNFTGSTRVGRRIAALCAKHLKRPLLELGGQAPMVVLEDADLELAAEAAVRGAYLNQGQICMSTERLIVSEDIADAFIDRLENLRQRLVVGDPGEAATDLGPVIDIAAAERLSGLVADAVSKGARLVGGGGTRDAFFEPTLIDGVEANMRLFSEETFGPVLTITRVASDKEAITIANDSEYGLAAAVFSKNTERAEAIARQIHSGICHINRCTVDDDPRAPFGGVKASGYGRFGGAWAFDEFTELRWITVQTST